MWVTVHRKVTDTMKMLLLLLTLTVTILILKKRVSLFYPELSGRSGGV